MAETIGNKSVRMHEETKGKIGVRIKVPLKTQEDLSKAYTPGVAAVCEEIVKDPEKAYDLTAKGNTVYVVSNGTAVLGLGNIGPLAGIPVMEGKCALFKEFADIDAFPLCPNVKDDEAFIEFVKGLETTAAGINLEDIKGPECVWIERRLKDEMNIPVFHDDQHGTAIVVAAALINATKFVGKELSDLTVVVSGTGAAGNAIIRMLKNNLGVKKIYAFNINGIITKKNYDSYDFVNQEISEMTNQQMKDISMAEAMCGADAFIGVSAANIVTPEMVSSMADNAIVFAMANPNPEIPYNAGKLAGAKVMGTGRSDFPNQINNLLAFPGVFRGALNCRASDITEGMKLAVARALAALVKPEELREDYIIPSPLDKRVVEAISTAVEVQARKEGINCI